MLGPQELLATQNKLGFLSGQVSSWVERVGLIGEGLVSVMFTSLVHSRRTCLLPGLEWVTPAVARWVVTDPSSATAVEVEVIRCGVDESVSALGNHLCVLGRNPDTGVGG